MNHKGNLKIAQNSRRLTRPLGSVGGDADVQRFAAVHRSRERAHRLLERGFGIKAMRVKNIHIVQS